MQSFYLGLNSRVDLFRLNVSKQPIEVAPWVIGYIRKKLVVDRNIPNLGDRPVNMLIKKTIAGLRPTCGQRNRLPLMFLRKPSPACGPPVARETGCH